MSNKDLPQFGQTVYWINEYDSISPVMKEGVICGMYIDEDDTVNIMTNPDKDCMGRLNFYKYSENKFWFSKQEAESVLTIKTKQWKEHDEIINKLKQELQSIYDTYRGQEIVVKIDDKNKTEPKWKRTIIKGIYIDSKQCDYYFIVSDKPYFISKENETWKFYKKKLESEMDIIKYE